MNFKIEDANNFILNETTRYKRLYAVRIKNEKVTIFNIKNGNKILTNIPIELITIDGNLMNNISELENILYNRSCDCGDEEPPERIRYFDRSFLATFE